MKKDSVLLNLGANVRLLRSKNKLTQKALAEIAVLDPTYISGIERGVRNPGIKNVARIARAISVTTAELCRGIDR